MLETTEATTEAGPRSGAFCFWTEGKPFTDLVRARVLDGEPDHALRILQDVEGLSMDQAFEILRGRLRFDGHTPRFPGDANTFTLIDEDADRTAAYQERVLWPWRMRFRDGIAWWEPYAYVTNYGEEDMPIEMRRRVPVAGADGREQRAKIGRSRAMHYADNPQDRLDSVGGLDLPGMHAPGMSVSVLSRRVPGPPVWLDVLLPRAAGSIDVAAVIAGPHMEERGWLQWYGVDRPPPTRPDAATEARQAAERARRADERDKAAADAAADFERRWARYGAEVRTQAEGLGGFLEVDIVRPADDTRPTHYRIPLAPFWRHAVRNARALQPTMDGRHFARFATWANVCPWSFKMANDNVDHSDWMCGAEPTIGVDDWYGAHQDKPLHSQIDKLLWDMCSDETGTPYRLLCCSDQGYTDFQTVLHPEPDQEVPAGSIIVVPHAGPEYYIPAASAMRGHGAIFCEQGGELAHLAVVGAEDGFFLIHLPEARTWFPAGARIRVRYSGGEVKVEHESGGGVL